MARQLIIDNSAFHELNEYVVLQMRLDRRTTVTKGDSLIRKYGAVLLR